MLQKWNFALRIVLVCALAFSHISIAQDKAVTASPSFNTFITARAIDDIPGSTPEKHFDCSDKIYTVIEVTAPERQTPSQHELIVDWLNPGNKLEQKTRYAFTSYGKGTRVWAWLRLSGPTGAAIAQIFDPAFGMGEFIGQWRAEVRIDGKKIVTHPFDVLC